MRDLNFVLGSKYDLRTKLILLIGANILIFLGFGLYYQSLITLFFIVIIISDGYKKSAIRYISFFVISVILEKTLTYINRNFIINLFLFFFVIGRKFLPCIIVGKWILNSTSSSLAVATLQKLKFSKDSLIMISVIFRCFPTIKDEWSHINMAMKTRGINFNLKNLLKKPLLILEYFFIPLFTSVLEIGDELSQSAIVRGLDAPVEKTSRHLTKFRKKDISVLILMILNLLIVILMKVSGWDL
ncbi:energy-coupling factor transporter transmembrane component T [Anaerococcus porci]|uniref:energy-coupling factor transporter transmembrane component T n=1 Tax=Anaerococcus porci TaxID=2652269 RepID=UPI002A76529E|nr:energy-coupling factor transporter transmembrane component T [Anaerococcus porci]MDY3007247.1 energy-coupling factor transporter transmembrane component T [Anaerococcus porci]